jgi:fatty-acyl-CoA synthase
MRRRSDTGLKPTDSGGCRLRLGDFSALTEALDYAASSRAGFNFYSARGELMEVLPYRDLRDQAVTLARRMLRATLSARDRVALVAETGSHFMRAFFACQYAGLIPVPLPAPGAFAGQASYVAHVRSLLAGATAAAVLTPTPYLEMIRQAAEPIGLKMIGTFAELDGLPEGGMDLPHIGQDDLSYVQFSSGSTRSPAGVAVNQRAVLANVRGIARDALGVNAADRCTSWLPFYHDMGLVGFILTPLATQVSTDYVAASEFARRPLVWPRLIAQNGSTISYSPSFGYDLCARRALAAPMDRLDLSRWRVAGIGGEMIRPGALAQFAAAFRGCGFRKEAFVASYGMAEATLGITFAPLDRGIEVDRIDLDLLQKGGGVTPVNGNGGRAREFVLCGRVLPGHQLQIRGADGTVLADRQVGRIMFRGPSVMQGYLSSRQETESVLSTDGWLDTGDLGYLLDGSLVVTGRSKDLILVNGRNVWPQDLEWAVERQVEGLRPGDVAAFSVDETERERIVLLVQSRQSDGAVREALRRKVGEVVLATAGLECTVVLVSHNGLPRTSSGKLSRVRARQMYLASMREESRAGAPTTSSAAHTAPVVESPL